MFVHVLRMPQMGLLIKHSKMNISPPTQGHQKDPNQVNEETKLRNILYDCTGGRKPAEILTNQKKISYQRAKGHNDLGN